MKMSRFADRSLKSPRCATGRHFRITFRSSPFIIPNSFAIVSIRVVREAPTFLFAQQRAHEFGSYRYRYNGSYETRAQQNPSQAGVSLTWPIFSGFRTYHESLAADEEIKGKEQLNARALRFCDLAEVFYQTLQYEEAELNYGDDANALRRRIAEVGRLIGLGYVPQGDLLVARSDLANSLVQAGANWALLIASKELPGFLIGKPPENGVFQTSRVCRRHRRLRHIWNDLKSARI